MEEHFGGLLDILVNNVGTNIRKATMDYTPEEFAHVMDTNFASLFLLTQVQYVLMMSHFSDDLCFSKSPFRVMCVWPSERHFRIRALHLWQ